LRRIPLALAALLSAIAVPLAAQDFDQRRDSAPAQTVPRIPQVQPRDIAYPGTMRLQIDATDVRRGIFNVVQTVPVAGPGRLTLLYPQWLPGNHAPRGPIASIAGLTVTAGNRPLAWRRDPTDVYAIHLDVPAGVREVRIAFQHLSPTAGAQGRIVTTPNMLNLQWEKMSFYPEGYFVRRIPVQASVTYPEGWRAATSLDVEEQRGGRITYRPVSYETLVDSPVFAGRYYRRERLAQNVNLNIFADGPGDLAATEEQLAAHRRLVEQSLLAFGARHFDEYEFLLALTDQLGGIGLEHLRSSENSQGRNYFTDWNGGSAGRDLLAHEFSHSWDGKYRRPAGMWTPDYRTPVQNDLLWVYEGQTQFWGNVLSARSGMMPAEDVLSELARAAAYYDLQPGRSWRPLVDTTYDPIIQSRRPQPWGTYMRSEDYYTEGMLIWLEVDARLRQLTGNRRSIDDFARAFYGVRDGDQGVNTYTFDDVVATLNGIAPFDWGAYLRQRVERTGPAPLAWIEAGGYRLVYRDTPSAYFRSRERDRELVDLTYSIGATFSNAGNVTGVQWNSPLFNEGVTVGAQVLAVNGRAWSAAGLRDAIRDAKGGREPIRLTIRKGDEYREVPLRYFDGLRYPALERTGAGPSTLDQLLAPRTN
jgi:predicted metalloprotease with PDZ domain